METAIDIENGGAKKVFNTIQKLVDEVKQNGLRQLLPPIYTVPSIIRDLKPSDFSPRVLSIGPLHRKERDFQVSEEQKVAYMYSLFYRLNSPAEETMKECVWIVHSNVGKIKARYAACWKTYDDEDLAKMMVIDGCFIVELIYRSRFGYPYDDPILAIPMVTLDVKRDLVLLENQIPFFVLQYIFDRTINKSEITYSLPVLLLKFLQDISPIDIDEATKNIGENHPHILGLLHNCLCFSDSMSSEWSDIKSYSAVELSRSGVNFKPTKQSPKDPLSMEFKATFWFPGFSWLHHEPALRMPKLIIQDHTESVLRNLITYEQCSHKIQICISSFAATMDDLVNTKEDVVQLVESQVVVNLLGSPEEAANMINSLCKGVVVNDDYYKSQRKELHGYCNQFWPKHIAWLRSNYFSSPWNIIALLAGFILFALTTVQTYYAIHTA